jgi:hypothetical protein
VAVFQVVAESRAEVRGKPDVIEFSAAVEGANTEAIADVLADGALVLFQRLPGNIFQVLAD